MWLCTDWKIDWNAISAVATAAAAVIALCVWLYDKHQRRLERKASARLLAQIMTTPVGAARVLLAKFRGDICPPGNDFSILHKLRSDENTRKQLVEKASDISIDLPSQFLDKADFFTEDVNGKLANAFAQVNRLKQIISLFGHQTDSTKQEEIDQHLESVLSQIKDAEKAAEAAFKALLVAGHASSQAT